MTKNIHIYETDIKYIIHYHSHSSCTAEYGEDIPYKSVDVDYTFNLAVDGRSVSTRSLAAATDENSLYDLNAFIFDASNGKAISFKYFPPSAMSNLSIPMLISGSSGSITFVSVRADITTRPPDRKSVPDDIVFFRLFKSARLVTVLPIDAPAFAIKAKIRLPEEPLINMGIERFDIAEGGKYLNDMAYETDIKYIIHYHSHHILYGGIWGRYPV